MSLIPKVFPTWCDILGKPQSRYAGMNGCLPYQDAPNGMKPICHGPKQHVHCPSMAPNTTNPNYLAYNAIPGCPLVGWPRSY